MLIEKPVAVGGILDDGLGGGLDAADEAIFEQVATSIQTEGFVVLPNAVPAHVSAALLQHLALYDDHEFATAAIGRGPGQELNTQVRRDKIAWIEAASPNSRTWIAWTQALQTYLNRRLFMGLFSFESHFAFYRPGDFYLTHVDAFRGQSNRILSLVTYLNEAWLPEQGGELVIYHPESAIELARVPPAFGTLVAFLSEEFPHEVKPASRTRCSVAGWFRVNTSTGDRADPPR